MADLKNLVNKSKFKDIKAPIKLDTPAFSSLDDDFISEEEKQTNKTKTRLQKDYKKEEEIKNNSRQKKERNKEIRLQQDYNKTTETLQERTPKKIERLQKDYRKDDKKTTKRRQKKNIYI